MDRLGSSCWKGRFALLVASLALASGCLSGDLRTGRTGLASTGCCGPTSVPSWRTVARRGETVAFYANDVDPVVARAEQDLAAAESLDRQGQARCVDFYYRATLRAAQVLQACGPAASRSCGSAWETYHRGLTGLLEAGQRYGRLDPRGQLAIHDGGPRVIPISYHGFAWRPADFSQLVRADQFHSREIAHRHTAPGLGLTLVGMRIAPCSNEQFFRPRQPFAVTAVLRPLCETPAGLGGESVLEFYNPYVSTAVEWPGAPTPLARDLTAPMAAVVSEAPRQYLRGFTAPTDTALKPQLVLIEPYQRGKIPVVFIHGLYSDPITWAETLNDLRSQGDLYRQYQFWVFRYPTGGAVLESAAALREKLQLARERFAPNHDDPGLDAMVLVGHSLGGLLSKVQIAHSYDLLWNQAARQPLEAVRAKPEVRLRLAQDFFFEPLPFVSRVVFVGTPHRGSGWSRRLAGRIGSNLVSFGAEANAEYRQLMDANRDVFKPYVLRSRPTSVDFLEPDSPFIVAIQQMPLNPAVQYHSIIGTGGLSPLGEAGDGVVTVSSARHPGAASELFVPAQHEKLHRHPDSIDELARILRQHAAQHSLRMIAVAGKPAA